MAESLEPEVWTRVALVAIAMQEEAGISMQELLAGLPFDEHSLKRRARIAWTDYTTIAERLCEAVGGFSEYEDLLAAQHHEIVPEIRVAVGALVSPKAFMRFMVNVVNPLLMPPVDFTYEDLDARRVRITARLQAGARPCEAFLRGGTGALRGMTMSIGLPMSKVVEADVSPTHGTWILELPEAQTIFRRAYRRAHRLMFKFDLGAENDGTPVSIVVGMPDVDPTTQRLGKIIEVWKLTQRQADVLRLMIAGSSNKEIADELGCSENTIELHIRRLLRKTATENREQLVRAFWSGPWGFSD